MDVKIENMHSHHIMDMNQYYVMNYSINSFTGASEANFRPGVEVINTALEGGDYH